MRPLLVISLLAGAAHADDRDVTLRELERSFGHHGGLEPPQCKLLLARLDAMGVPEKTPVFASRYGVRTVGEARVRCGEIEHDAKVEYMVGAIAKAVEFPWAWAGECMDRWPRAIAAGLQPKERIERAVPGGRRGRIVLTGTIEQLRVKWCDNAYTPRRRGE